MNAAHDFKDMDDFDSAPVAKAPTAPSTKTAEEAYFEAAANAPAPNEHDTREREPCRKCHGSGRFHSWSGRSLGECFHCKGTGKGALKATAKARATTQKRAATKKADAAAKAGAAAQAWRDANPALAAWLDGNKSFEFAASLTVALNKYGSLTPGQCAAIDRCIVKSAERQAARAQEVAKSTTVVDSAGLSKLVAMFDAAAASGLKRIRVTVGRLTFSPAKATGKNPGAVYVKDHGEYAGKIVNGHLLPVRGAAEDFGARVAAIAADPLAALVAHGKETGTCSCCGRELTDPVSIAAGIGPICASNYGF